MLKTSVLGSRIYHAGKAQLLDAVEALHHGMCDYLHDDALGDIDESEYGVVDYLAILHNKFMSNTETQRHGDFYDKYKKSVSLCLCVF